MNELSTIQSALEQAARRQRLSRALRGLWFGLLIASTVWLATLVAFKVYPLPLITFAISGALGLACVVVGAVVGGWRKPTVTETARWVDVKQNLKERLSTALEVSQTPTDGEWKNLLVRDAAEHARGLDARQLLPFHLPKFARWALVLLAVAAGLGFVPEYRSKALQQKQADAAIIKDTGKQLAEVTRRAIENKPPTLEPTAKALEQVEELGAQLNKASLTKTEALKEISSVREKIEKEAKDLPPPPTKALEKAARENNAGSSSQSQDGLQKQMDALQKSLGAAAGNDPEKLDKMKSDMAKAQKMAANLPDKESPEGKAAREQLQQMMSSMAQQMESAGVSAENLEDALKALEQGNIDQFLKDMDVAANDLQKLSDMAKQLQAMQQQNAEQMGKDLAEQLKKGQTDAAQKTLAQMASQLKKGQMTKEQLDKMLSEVSKAVDPASEYGKVAQHLKDAVKQMQQCNNPGSSDGQKQQAKEGAAQSLADAQKELEKLAQQMADAQQLAETLAMLEKAQQAIASGKGWGQCKGAGFNPRPGNGRAGKASGVGTWTDDTGWTYYPKDVPQDPVDNSAIQRPDMDARGLTERDTSLNENLSPTKVKGQLDPKGQMPSVTLKGVSIKGQSKVQYEEAAAAAQKEAQSALNQDQVPRAYRGAVRDYFDDNLKNIQK
jgi:hypothetical protein